MKPAASQIRVDNASVYREACRRFLPTTRQEMEWRGWDELDVLLVNGDAYVDHPTFGIPMLGRFLESLGLKVGIVSQPRWDTLEDVKAMGRPRLFIGVSAGTVDSLINNYTANKKVRSDDQYAPGGTGGKRPDYASVVYSKLAREAFPDVPVVVGGVEVSLRRLAHYDYWQNRIRPSTLLDLKGFADLLVFGMGERQTRVLVEVLTAAAAESPDGRVTLGSEPAARALARMREQRGIAYLLPREQARDIQPRLTLPSFEEVRDDKKKFARAAYFIEYEASPYNGRRLMQHHGAHSVVVNSPALPLSTEELDAIYELPFTKEQHPQYSARIPAADMIRFSVNALRGCFGGCSFCAITLHQGRVVQSRSEGSILKELGGMKDVPGFKGSVSDVGGPTANMWNLRCRSTEVQSKCRKLSCVHPKVCPHLHKDQKPLTELMRKARKVPGVKNIRISSGLRYDIALAAGESGQEYLRDLITHHVGGQLKVAPEHLDDEVLHLMKKPGLKNFDQFVSFFEKVSAEVGKEQYVVPYFISGFPGTTHEKMEKIHDYLKEKGWNLQQVQAFIPTPMTLATAMYWSGIDPMSKQALYVAKEWKDRKLQQALLQPNKPQHREILLGYRRGKRRGAAFQGGSVASPHAGRPSSKRPSGASSAGPGKRSIVEPPRSWLGPKLLLDER
ncbi:MAG: YgiQ family radical SAM protein [Bdellovibrionales bacterium]|nr:YgiQ family radical SAM protein [Bdellovibrionales bacterium]